MSATQSKINLPMVAITAGLMLALGLFVGRELIGGEQPPTAADRGAATQAARAVSAERFKIPVTDTQPSLGPVDALVTIIEFCDLRGPSARRADAALRAVMKAYDGKVRWIHRTMVDAARPTQSHRMHAVARAGFQHGGKFWELREQLLKTPDGVELTDQDYARITREAGLDFDSLDKAIANRQFDGAISFDSAFSMKFGVTGGLGLFVNGRKVNTDAGRDLTADLQAAIEDELIVAQRLVQDGVAPDQLYAEMTKDGRWGVSEKDELARKAKLAEQR